MGRFYKTASASPLDYMHKINAPLMERALQFNDQAISAQADQGQAIGSAALNFKRLADDDPDAALIAKQYNDQVNQLSKTMAADPANWRKQMEPLRTLKKDLLDNYTTGPIAKMQANYGAYQTWKTKIDKAVEKGTLDPYTAKRYEDYYLDNWRKNGTGTGFKNGRYNVLRMEDVMANMDIKKEVSAGFDKVKADLNATEIYDKPGQYLIKRGNSTEEVPKSRLYELAMANLSPTLQSYMRSRQQVGLLNNIYDKDGNFINPVSGFGIDPEAIARANKIIEQTKISDPTKAAQMQEEFAAYLDQEKENPRYNPNSGLSDIFKGAIESSAWSKNKQTLDIKANPIWMKGQDINQKVLDRTLKADIFGQTRQDKIDAATTKFDRDKELIELRKKAAVEVKSTGKVKPATKAAIDKNNAIGYLQEIPAAQNHFIDDINAGTPEGESRARLSVEEAIPNVLKQLKGTVGGEKRADYLNSYIRFLNGQPATEEMASKFYNIQKQVDPYNLALHLGAGSKNPNAQRNPIEILKEAGNIYNKEVENIYQRDNQVASSSEGHPLNEVASVQLAQSINNSKGFFSLDENNNPISVPKITKIISAHNGSSQGKMGFKALNDKGEEVWVFPNRPTAGNNNEAAYNLARNGTLIGLVDDKSVFAKSLKEQSINDLISQFGNGKHTSARKGYSNDKEVLLPAGKSAVVTIGGENFSAILHDNTGKVTLREPDGDIIGEFDNVPDVIGWYNTLLKQHQEAEAKKLKK